MATQHYSELGSQNLVRSDSLGEKRRSYSQPLIRVSRAHAVVTGGTVSGNEKTPGLGDPTKRNAT